jgi:hypothetical protein
MDISIERRFQKKIENLYKHEPSLINKRDIIDIILSRTDSMFETFYLRIEIKEKTKSYLFELLDDINLFFFVMYKYLFYDLSKICDKYIPDILDNKINKYFNALQGIIYYHLYNDIELYKKNFEGCIYDLTNKTIYEESAFKLKIEEIAEEFSLWQEDVPHTYEIQYDNLHLIPYTFTDIITVTIVKVFKIISQKLFANNVKNLEFDDIKYIFTAMFCNSTPNSLKEHYSSFKKYLEQNPESKKRIGFLLEDDESSSKELRAIETMDIMSILRTIPRLIKKYFMNQINGELFKDFDSNTVYDPIKEDIEYTLRVVLVDYGVHDVDALNVYNDHILRLYLFIVKDCLCSLSGQCTIIYGETHDEQMKNNRKLLEIDAILTG